MEDWHNVTSNGQRILTGCIALPALLIIILFLPQLNYLAFALIVLCASIIGSHEMHNILTHDKENMKLPLPFWTGALLPVAAYIEYSLGSDSAIILYTMIVLMSLAFLIETITGHRDNFAGTRDRASAAVIQLLYPNLFAIFFIRLCFLQDAWMWLLTFFLLVFSCDTFAYFFGRAFGKNNRGIVKVSPNKSVAGFIAGALIPGLIFLLLTLFIDTYGLSPAMGFIVGLATALAGICGDLIESAFKRSSSLKDSGVAIPGRGGILDSIDSLIIAAPVYFALLHIFQVTV